MVVVVAVAVVVAGVVVVIVLIVIIVVAAAVVAAAVVVALVVVEAVVVLVSVVVVEVERQLRARAFQDEKAERGARAQGSKIWRTGFFFDEESGAAEPARLKQFVSRDL